ncbi:MULTISPECIES: SSI family serine proteinase inhibitor [Streptomyces]|uniref:Subtilisin inhibitor domain-containing protein n=1 Tax=Streptomyces dengpaensis TaxID=2049881 RepID=A0ABM6STX8_9ACTN|nr:MULTISPECIES: SSI family serine proteinase inhibitor [Streptomyces]AVH57766.1 hypothetical protein C4B68_20560 [Streptomyces dengpaensis]PIB03483.1 hypothetical protein B1C81_36920 [Streptomyces sp. HG99]
MLHRLLFTAAASAAALAGVPAGQAAVSPTGPVAVSPTGLATTTYGEPVLSAPAPMPPPGRDEDLGDRLTVTVHDAEGVTDGSYELRCHPDGGSHPDVSGACQKLDQSTGWGKDVFAPVPSGSVCTMVYGGPATAHVTGTWAGRPVDAKFDRTNGCEIARWDALVPLLPGGPA